MQHVCRAQTESWPDMVLGFLGLYSAWNLSNISSFRQTFPKKHLRHFLFIYIYIFIFVRWTHSTAQHSVCENLHSLEVYRQCQIDDVQTAAERAVRGFYKELRGVTAESSWHEPWPYTSLECQHARSCAHADTLGNSQNTHASACADTCWGFPSPCLTLSFTHTHTHIYTDLQSLKAMAVATNVLQGPSK